MHFERNVPVGLTQTKKKSDQNDLFSLQLSVRTGDCDMSMRISAGQTPTKCLARDSRPAFYPPISAQNASYDMFMCISTAPARRGKTCTRATRAFFFNHSKWFLADVHAHFGRAKLAQNAGLGNSIRFFPSQFPH